MNRRLFIYGPPASGKTTLGRVLAAALGCQFADIDETVVRTVGMTIPEIFAKGGEAEFRTYERRALAEVVGSEAKVVALGGGTLLDAANRRICEAEGATLCLVSPGDEELKRRMASENGSRPLGCQAKQRADHYASFPGRISAYFEINGSLVLVGRSIASWFLEQGRLIADSGVAATLSDAVRRCVFATVPNGERHKTLVTVASLWASFAKAGVGRNDRVTAIGGGVTGDLVGFAAATWMRGIDWVNVPTTLLSMVDASVGGKTGCDMPEGKNLVGAFHSPKLVVIDTDYLATLPASAVADGCAEMIKHCIIGGLDSSRIVRGKTPSADEVARNLSVKVGIVRDDPLERKGRRLLLNCGHTVGHAVEKASGYALSHGKSVSIGCVEEARLAVRLGLAAPDWPDELVARFDAAGLPVELPEGMSFESIAPLMLSDKKREGSMVNFALPCGWGDVRCIRIDPLTRERG